MYVSTSTHATVPCDPLGNGSQSNLYHSQHRHTGMIWEFLIFRKAACCGRLDIDTLVWQVGKSGSQSQVRSLSHSVGALLLFSVCANVSKKPRISKQVVQKQSWTTYLWCSAVCLKPGQKRQKETQTSTVMADFREKKMVSPPRYSYISGKPLKYYPHTPTSRTLSGHK